MNSKPNIGLLTIEELGLTIKHITEIGDDIHGLVENVGKHAYSSLEIVFNCYNDGSATDGRPCLVSNKSARIEHLLPGDMWSFSIETASREIVDYRRPKTCRLVFVHAVRQPDNYVAALSLTPQGFEVVAI